MKNDFTRSMTTLFFALGMTIVAASNAVAIDFIYCQAPDGRVRAISTTYASDCKGFASPGSRQITEIRAKVLFEEERMRALGLDNEQLLETQSGSDNESGKIQGSGTGTNQ
jgi:hypothetical protein